MSDESYASSPEPDKPAEQHESFLDHVEHAAEEVEHALEHDHAASDALAATSSEPDAKPDVSAPENVADASQPTEGPASAETREDAPADLGGVKLKAGSPEPPNSYEGGDTKIAPQPGPQDNSKLDNAVECPACQYRFDPKKPKLAS